MLSLGKGGLQLFKIFIEARAEQEGLQKQSRCFGLLLLNKKSFNTALPWWMEALKVWCRRRRRRRCCCFSLQYPAGALHAPGVNCRLADFRSAAFYSEFDKTLNLASNKS